MARRGSIIQRERRGAELSAPAASVYGDRSDARVAAGRRKCGRPLEITFLIVQREELVMADTFGARSTLRVGDREYEMFRLSSLEKEGLNVARLPYSLR